VTFSSIAPQAEHRGKSCGEPLTVKPVTMGNQVNLVSLLEALHVTVKHWKICLCEDFTLFYLLYFFSTTLQHVIRIVLTRNAHPPNPPKKRNKSGAHEQSVTAN